jgi:autotransporter-associated beta strand protein
LDLNSHTLTIAGNARTSISNRIVDTGALVKDGLGELLLSGGLANTFSGGVTVNGGTVTVGKIGALGTGPLALNGGVLNLGSYNATVSAFTLHGGSLSSSGGQLVSSSGYQVESGTIASGLGGSGRLTKSGAGTVTLLAGNTYAGGTEISGGKLVANNTLGSATGTGSVLVRGGGLLTGSGSISGIVTNGLGGSISAGDEIGVLHLGSTLWLGGATNRWDISDATGGAGVGWDLLSINGSLTLSATTDERAIIDIVSFTLSDQPGLASNFDPTQNYLWTIVQTTGGIYFPSGEDATTIFDLFTGNFANSTAGSFGLTVSADGRSLNVFYAAALPVPEPNQIVLMGLGLCGLVYIRRFKQHWA